MGGHDENYSQKKFQKQAGFVGPSEPRNGTTPITGTRPRGQREASIEKSSWAIRDGSCWRRVLDRPYVVDGAAPDSLHRSCLHYGFCDIFRDCDGLLH